MVVTGSGLVWVIIVTENSSVMGCCRDSLWLCQEILTFRYVFYIETNQIKSKQSKIKQNRMCLLISSIGYDFLLTTTFINLTHGVFSTSQKLYKHNTRLDIL